MAGLMTPTSQHMALPCLEKSVFESQKAVMFSSQLGCEILVKTEAKFCAENAQ